MIVADASWVIALLDPDDIHHQAAKELNDSSTGATVLLHPVTLAECLVGPARLERLNDAASALRSAFETVEVDVDAPLRWALLRATRALRLPDVIVLDTAITHAATSIFTFDERLAVVARSMSIECPAPE